MAALAVVVALVIISLLAFSMTLAPLVALATPHL
jgi:hypothetical protein